MCNGRAKTCRSFGYGLRTTASGAGQCFCRSAACARCSQRGGPGKPPSRASLAPTEARVRRHSGLPIDRYGG
ncbi:hypothetical protein C4K33_4702 [Pseudomonas chlororaphis subsp. piscium]|nr:hypothetical protein C4K33_4702 [Pseudomonas chlororaphis subsp. piscium]AZC83856.1 hypothetical protein C4K30_4764 [Pseudomonas chlororaphis subsp. piscium]